MRTRQIVLALLIWTLAAGAWGIEKSHDHLGEYLILPLAVASEQFDTLMQLNSPPEVGQRAIKFRLLDRQGLPVLSANLYLPVGATWTAALTSSGDQSQLITGPDGCFLVEIDGEVQAVDSIEVDFDAGFVEWVEMGYFRFTGESPSLATLTDTGQCEEIAALWMDPEWAEDPDRHLRVPHGNLRASASIINVEAGTMYSLTATALTGFSNIPQHFPPGVPRPNLADTHDEGTPSGETTSVVCIEGNCITDTWANPIDAASAALMIHEARGDFIVAEEINARSEWIVTYPTRAYYDSEDPFYQLRLSLFLGDRSGVWQGWNAIPNLPQDFLDHIATFAHHDSMEVMDFNNTVDDLWEIQPSSIFGIIHEVQFPRDAEHRAIPDAGFARLGFESYNSNLIANSGRQYRGRPALVWSFQEYENAMLQGPDGTLQRANYGNAFQTSVIRRVREP